ncbi:MAG: hypothetical protein HY436_00615 [Candidatus Liptonbacteria bacterium]|nr:hypothetical protein [Candidatus Liptonbacteria bacterium]
MPSDKLWCGNIYVRPDPSRKIIVINTPDGTETAIAREGGGLTAWHETSAPRGIRISYTIHDIPDEFAALARAIALLKTVSGPCIPDALTLLHRELRRMPFTRRAEKYLA